MKIKKKQIEEATLGVGVQQQGQNTSSMPSTQEIKGTTSAIKDATDAIKSAGKIADENPLPFMTKVDEGSGDYAEYMAWKNDEIRNAFHEWLVSTPEGQAYTEKISQQQSNQPEDNPTDDLPFENFKDNRKVIKTIKLKDLK